MRKLVRILAGALVPAFLVAGVVASPANAQDKAKAGEAKKGMATRTVLAENDKVLVLEIRQKPGEQNKPTTTQTRVIRALSAATILRTYADGKTEKKAWKAGEVEIQLPGPEYSTKNVGNSEFRIYAVVLK